MRVIAEVTKPLRSWRWATTRRQRKLVNYDPHRHRIARLAGRSRADWRTACRRATEDGPPWAVVITRSPEYTIDYEGGKWGYSVGEEWAKTVAHDEEV